MYLTISVTRAQENKELRDQVASLESRLLQASRRILAHNMRGEHNVPAGDDLTPPNPNPNVNGCSGSGTAGDAQVRPLRGESIDSSDLNWSFNRGSGSVDATGGGFSPPPPPPVFNGRDASGAAGGKSIFDEIASASRDEVRAFFLELSLLSTTLCQLITKADLF